MPNMDVFRGSETRKKNIDKIYKIVGDGKKIIQTNIKETKI